MMKRYFITFMLVLSTLFLTSSCATTAYADDVVISNDNATLIMHLGTPFYYNGYL